METIRVYAILRPYLYHEKVVALVDTKYAAELLAEKWQCRIEPRDIPASLFKAKPIKEKK